MKRRGIENILLRRVRRHQSMTALFRAPDLDSKRPFQPRAWPVLQQKEQDSLVDTQAAEVRSTFPVIPPRADPGVRQPVHPPASAPQSPAAQTAASSPKESSATPDPVWKRLQTIFRKHQAQNDPQTTNTTDSEDDATEPNQVQMQEEKELPQTTSTEEHILPTRNPEMAIPTVRSIQRSFESAEPKSEPASPDVHRKVQTLSSSTSPEIKKPERARNIEIKPTLLDRRTEVNDQTSIANEPEEPLLPLEAVWNVQRVESAHPLFYKNTPRPRPSSEAPKADENEALLKTSQAPDQKPGSGPALFHREDERPIETSMADPLSASEQRGEPREPVEILSPSRPRPSQATLPPGSLSIQRQIQDNHATNDASETPPVNTAIGPLPADLWWLLGQKPPTDRPVSQPAVQRTIDPGQKEAPASENKVSNSQPAEPQTEPPSMRGVIQRQILPKDSLPSRGQEPTSPPNVEEPKHMESLDLDDLARRVYAEVRRRLAAEWERRR
jgi:hypothetical protein